MIIGRIARLCLMTSLFGTFAVSGARAQTDMTAMMRNSAANELGILEYCQNAGHIDGAAVAAQRTVIARLPAGAPTDAAETLGKQGTLLASNSNNVPMSEMASKGNTTEAALCTQMAGTVKQAATNNPAMSMPAMPGGMPAMPNGMGQMPSGMPTPPAMPPH